MNKRSGLSLANTILGDLNDEQLFIVLYKLVISLFEHDIWLFLDASEVSVLLNTYYGIDENRGNFERLKGVLAQITEDRKLISSVDGKFFRQARSNEYFDNNGL